MCVCVCLCVGSLFFMQSSMYFLFVAEEERAGCFTLWSRCHVKKDDVYLSVSLHFGAVA